MTRFKYLVFFFILITCFSCKTNNNKNCKGISDLGEPAGYEDEGSNRVREFLEVFIDSSNNYMSNQLIPSFLYDQNFDLADTSVLIYYAYWGIKPEFYSLRVELFKYINNIDLLNTLVIENNECFKNINQNRYLLPSDKITNVDLAKIRLWEIENKKDSLSNLCLTPSKWTDFKKFNIDIKHSIEFRNLKISSQ